MGGQHMFFNACSRTERSRNSVMEETGGENHHGGELWDSKGCFGQQGIRNQCQNSQASNGVKKKAKQGHKLLSTQVHK